MFFNSFLEIILNRKTTKTTKQKTIPTSFFLFNFSFVTLIMFFFLSTYSTAPNCLRNAPFAPFLPLFLFLDGSENTEPPLLEEEASLE